MSDLAHKLLAELEHAGIGGAGIKALADEHLPAVDPETGVRGKAKPASSGSTTRKRTRSRSSSSGSKAKATTAGTSGGTAASTGGQ